MRMQLMSRIAAGAGLVLAACSSGGLAADTFHVGAGEAFTTIQAAIDAAADGDTIIVRDGTYTGPGNTLRSENGPHRCIVDADTAGRCFSFTSGEGADTVLEGFTITGGRGSGAGVYCVDSSPVIKNNVIVENWALSVGAYCNGGGIYCERSSALIVNNTIVENGTTGERIGCGSSTWGGRGGGVYIVDSPVTITNCIIRGNIADEGNPQVFGSPSIRYSNVEGGFPGDGNIDEDPLFADPFHFDFHLLSSYGRWTEHGWVADEESSPCIDAGDPASDYLREPGGNGERVNMGAYGNTPQASRGGYLLTVASSPVSGMLIAGEMPGVTEYAATRQDRECIEVSAPQFAAVGGKTYRFDYWVLNGRLMRLNQRDVVVLMDGDNDLEAVYRLLGDANGDCRVSILDLIFVRNRINADVESEDNWQADVNADGKISILDLIAVRNSMNAKCRE